MTLEPIEVEMKLAASSSAPAQARAGIWRLREVLDGNLFADLQLVLSELVTNSAKYGPGEPITVSVRCDGDEITGDVSDRSEGRIDLPPQRRPGEAKIGRSGLWIVDRLTTDWGLRSSGRTVWFKLAA